MDITKKLNNLTDTKLILLALEGILDKSSKHECEDISCLLCMLKKELQKRTKIKTKGINVLEARKRSGAYDFHRVGLP